MHFRFQTFSLLISILILLRVPDLCAQEHTVLFSPTNPGVTHSITNWGLDTCWTDANNMQRGLIFMGSNNVNIIRVGFVVDAPLTNNDISPAQKTTLQNMANVAAMAGPNTRWDMNEASSVDPWYQSGANLIYASRWAAAIQACQRYYNRNFWSVEGFNEPDYSPWGEGSQQNLYDIMGVLKASTNFVSAAMAGGSTLNDDVALSWFNATAPRALIGSTHCLAGSVSSYVTFIQRVTASNSIPFNPELHNVVEAIIGANYGLKGGIWWGTAERARGEFVNACQGKQLGYAEDWANWTAAAVYRGTSGAVQAFVGASERMGVTTTYRFFSKDRDVFYDGYGPQRDFTVTIPGGANAERVVNISWGTDTPPPINGRYLVVNRNSGKVLEVPGASIGNGTVLDQTTYTGASNQQWDINLMPSNSVGDYSYYTIKAAHDGVTADLNNWSYANGDVIQQWNGGTNLLEQWYFQYAGNGYFHIRNRWSGKFVSVRGASTSSGAQIVQWDDLGSTDQQWRLIPANVPSYDFVAPAAPSGVSATANALSAQLNWTSSPEPDLAGYTVLRGTSSGGPYDVIARGLSTNSFIDKSANQPKPYFYVVKAVDQSLNSSSNSVEVSATPSCGPALVARYSLNGNASDSSGNANHPIVINGSATFTVGRYAAGLALNGANQYLMLPANMLASVTNFTIAAWAYWNGGNAWQRVFDFGNDTTQYMFLTPSSGSGTLRFAITTNGAGAEQILQTSPLPTNQWLHVAVTRSGNIARLYTNGVLAASTTVSIFPATINPALNYLGHSQYDADPLFNGRLDELFIYNVALSGPDIGRLMNNQPPSAMPTALTATPGDAQVTLSWNASAGAASYNVKRATASGGPYVIIASAVGSTNYTDTGLSNGTTHFYVVSATTTAGESANSNQASATPASATPPQLSFEVAGEQVLLTWPTDHTSWRLQAQTNSLGTNWFDVPGSTSTNYLALPIDLNNHNVFYRLIYP